MFVTVCFSQSSPEKNVPITFVYIALFTYTYIPFPQITVFDFPKVLETTERRVRDDLLGGGPGTVEELRALHAKLKVGYEADAAKKRSRQPPPSLPKFTMGGSGATGVSLVDRIKIPKVSFPNMMISPAVAPVAPSAPDLLSSPAPPPTEFSIGDEDDDENI